MSIVLWASIAGAMVLVALVLLFRKVLQPGTSTSIDAAWLTGFSLDYYQPMTRLLREDDYRFLESQPGFTSALASDLRKKRRRILTAYLRNLGRDFERLHKAARVFALFAPEGNPDLVRALVAQSFAFWTAMIEIRVRLMLPAVPVDVEELIRRISWLRGQVAVYLPAAS